MTKSMLTIVDVAYPSKNKWIENSKMRYLLFTLMCLGYVSNGINLSIIGPSIGELATIYGTSLESVSFGFTIKAISNCLCSIVAGYTMTRYSRHLQYSLGLVVYGINTCLLPQLPSLNWFWSAWAVYGGTSAFIDIAINVWVLELFELHNMNLHVQIIHLSFSFGQVFGPLMVGPYLVQDATLAIPQNAVAIAQQSKLIRLPYLAAGSCFLFVGLCVLICYFVEPYHPPNRKVFGPKRIRQHSVGAESSQLDQQSLHLSTGSAQPLWFRALFIALLFGLFSVEVSCEYNLLMYLAPYLSRGRANISRQSAANLSATFGLAYVTGRGTSMLLALSRRVPVSSVFYTQMMTALIAGVLFAVRSLSDHAWAIWAAVILIGLGFSSAFPNMMVFIEQRVNITDRLNCAMLALSTLLFSACSPLLGHVLDARPQTFERIMIGAIVALLSLFAALHFTDRIRNRLNKQFQMRSAANSRF